MICSSRSARARRLANRHTPVPSQKISFTRSARLARKTYTAPENGLVFIVSRTNAASPSTPLRKSTGRIATITRTAPCGPIICQPSTHGRRPQSSSHPHPGQSAPARRQSRVQSPARHRLLCTSRACHQASPPWVAAVLPGIMLKQISRWAKGQFFNALNARTRPFRTFTCHCTPSVQQQLARLVGVVVH